MVALGPPEAVLFDLDGTLIDSAPDLLAALDRVVAGLGVRNTGHEKLREHVSRGANGLLAAGLPGWAELPDREQARLRTQLLAHYESHCWVRSAPFEGIEPLLDELARRGIRIGVVTNKISRFAEPVLERAGWAARFGCLVTGDRVSAPKPAAEPVLAACQSLAVSPEQCWFVGDDRRDVEAGKAAGTRTVVAEWGYLPVDEDATRWGADAVIARPGELLDLFGAGRY